MVILHLKMRIRQDANMQMVKDIVSRHPKAVLDDDNYYVYYNYESDDVDALKNELLPFEYDSEIVLETF